MKKLFWCCCVTLSLLAFGACGDEEEKSDPTLEDGGMVADGGDTTPDGGQNEGNDAGPEEFLDCSLCKTGEICKGNKECAPPDYGQPCDETFHERCDENVAVYCGQTGTITAIKCSEDAKCAFGVSELGGDGWGVYDWGVDCMLPCPKDVQVGEETSHCGTDEYEGYVIVRLCSHLADGTSGSYWTHEYQCDEIRGCDEDSGLCGKLIPDEGKWCTNEEYEDPTVPKPFVERCLDDKSGAVICQGDEVTVGLCTEKDAQCRLLADDNWAACYTPAQSCKTPGESTPKECYQDGSKVWLVSYTCLATQDEGVNVWRMNKGSVQCDSSCIPGATEGADAQCAQKDDRVGQACTKDTPNTCGNGGVLLTCGLNADNNYVWSIVEDCTLKSEGGVCKTPKGEGKAGQCFKPSDACTTADQVLGHHCEGNEILGGSGTLTYSYPTVCTLMADNSLYAVNGVNELCNNGCDAQSGKCLEE